MITTEQDNMIYTLVQAARETVDGLWLANPDRASRLSGALQAAWVMYRRAPREGEVQEYLFNELLEFVDDLLLLDHEGPDAQHRCGGIAADQDGPAAVVNFAVDFTVSAPANGNVYGTLFYGSDPDDDDDLDLEEPEDPPEEAGTVRRVHPWREGITI